MKIIRMLWPGGKRGACTSTWDDGTAFDRRLIGLFRPYGLKGSFYLNSGALGKTAAESGWKDYVRPDEVATLYAGLEIGSHTVSHPHPWQVPADGLREEFLADRQRLEELAGYPIRGAVVPFGWDAGMEAVADLLGAWGFRYVRSTAPTNRFEHPHDFLRWRPTAHCSVDLSALWDRFAQQLPHTPGALLNVWGHSYEFEDRAQWAQVEAFAAKAGASAETWHATNGEVFDYLTAWRGLAWTLDGARVLNPSAQTVWLLRDGTPVSAAPGLTIF